MEEISSTMWCMRLGSLKKFESIQMILEIVSFFLLTAIWFPLLENFLLLLLLL